MSSINDLFTLQRTDYSYPGRLVVTSTTLLQYRPFPCHSDYPRSLTSCGIDLERKE